MRSKQEKNRDLVKQIFFLVTGSLLAAVGLEIFLIPNSIIDGGIIGISIMVSYLTKAPLSLFILLFNLPFLIVGYRQIGKGFALATIFSTVCLSIFVNFFHPIPGFTHDLLLASVFGGIILGIGVGTIIRYGGALDGTEILAILVSRKTAFSVGEIVMFFNIFILGSAGFIFGWDRAMYSLITYFIAFKMIDTAVEGLDESRSVMIISDFCQEVSEALQANLGRGVTHLHGKGGYSSEDKEVLYCVMTRLEIAKMKNIIEDIDPGAFVAIGNVHEVMGGRFKKSKVH